MRGSASGCSSTSTGGVRTRLTTPVPTTTHFVLGDSAGGSLRRVNPDAHIIVIRDVFTEGPCRFDGVVDHESWMRRRAAWWADQGEVMGEGMAEAAEEDVEKLTRASSQLVGGRAVVWLGESLSEQLMLCWLSALLLEESGSGTELAYAQSTLPWGCHTMGLVHEEQLSAVTPIGTSASERHRALAAWNAFVEPSPERFARLALEARGEAAFGQLLAALGRFPALDDGLTRWERDVLSSIHQGGGEKCAYNIGHVLGRNTGPDFIGGLVLFERLRELAGQGLLEQSGGGAFMNNTHFELTALGLDVLEGRKNRVDVAGFDRWVGGTHLEAGSNMWWFEGDSVRRR